MALAYLTGTVTQGSNDAFAQGEIATALSGVTNFAYRAREILVEYTGTPANAAFNIEIAITRRSKTAMPVVTDRDVLLKWMLQSLFTTSGAHNFPRVNRFTFTEDDELLIVEDPLYVSIDSNAAVAAATANVRIGYERVSISAVDRLTLLTQSLD